MASGLRSGPTTSSCLFCGLEGSPVLKQVGHTNEDPEVRGHLLPRLLKGSAVCVTVSISEKGEHIAKAISV